ncbi:precorrin-6Y C5,15-methyltransferase (decarboxylating) subunit CbiT [Roseburia hominis]
MEMRENGQVRQVYCIGIGMGNEKFLTAQAKECIEASDILIGAKRMLEPFVQGRDKCPSEVCSDVNCCSEEYLVKRPNGHTGYPSVYLEEYRPAQIREYLLAHTEFTKCAVLLSGDTGFYSGAKKLACVLEECGIKVEFLPGISSVVYLAARLHTSWEDAALVSLHGRRQNFIHAISRNKKAFLILGADEGKMLCEKIAYYGMGHVRFHIGRNLSYEEEEILSVFGSEIRPEQFAGLVTVMVENPEPVRSVMLHIPDEEFIRGKVPMTKEEVRTVSISKMKLTEDAVVYDVGAGTGSVSIEAALAAPGIKVYAIEKNPEGVRLIRENARKFKTDLVQIIEGLAPEVLEGLESPTHVFIGGSSGNLKEILKVVREKNPQARIVINAISLETMQEVMEAFQEGILQDPEIVQMTVAKSRKLGNYHMMTGQNPIYIVAD